MDIFNMSSINPFRSISDPYISPQSHIENQSLTPSVESIVSIENLNPQTLNSQDLFPLIAQSISDLPNESIIVYRGSPIGQCSGPNIVIPTLNLAVNNSQEHSQIHVSCTSTYPEAAPYNPIADRYEVRLFRDGWILTLADGCGLQPCSRQAPKAAMEGFWNYLTDRLKNDHEGFKVQKLAQYLLEAIKAGHFNIYWDAYLRNQDGYKAHLNEVTSNLRAPQSQADEASTEKTNKELRNIIEALKGDRSSQKILVEKNLDPSLFMNFAGATTFLCSALIKGGASSAPYYLLSVSLGDCKGYLYRDGSLVEVTKDSREDISNPRDPGGKIGMCTPVPLLIDSRNLQYSLTSCKSQDLLFFMTDGVVDNLDPERLGLLPKASSSPDYILSKIQQAARLEPEEFEQLINLLSLDVDTWNLISNEEGNAIKANFGRALLEKIIQKSTDPKDANERISQFCHDITSDYREEKPHFTSLFQSDFTPIGKPDHTTCLTIQVP